jgi:hypothetical protein
MIPGWETEIAAAQNHTCRRLCGRVLDRVPYQIDAFDFSSDMDGRCHDCGVYPTQLHVPGCDMERCACCGGQVVSCGCAEGAE